MVEETYRIVSRNTAKYTLDGYSGSCSRDDWTRGEGIFLEGCKCHPHRNKKLIAVVLCGDVYDYFTIVAKKEVI